MPSPTDTFSPPRSIHVEEHFVPMPIYTSKSKSVYISPTPISFDPASSDALGSSSDGTPFVECLSGTGLRDPDQTLFHDQRRKGRLSITFVLKWPGYDYVVWEDIISILGANGGLITRRELAFQVASQFKDFVAKCDELNIQSTWPEWRVGASGYDISSMCLSGLWSPSEGVWQASVRVRSIVL